MTHWFARAFVPTSLRVDGGLKFARISCWPLFSARTNSVLARVPAGDRMRHGAAMPSQHLPVGIATQDEKLRTKFTGKPEMVIAYFRSLAEEVAQSAGAAWVRSLSELTGWYDRLSARSGMDPFLVVPISPRIGLRRSKSPASTSRPWKIRFISMLR